MGKKKDIRMGSDPLSWIKDSRNQEETQSISESQSNSENPSKQSKQGKHSNSRKQSKKDIQSNTSNQELQGKLSKHSNSSKQSKLSSTNTSQKGLPAGWSRATFIIRNEYLDKIKALAYWDRKEIKAVMDEALESYLSGKDVKPISFKKS